MRKNNVANILFIVGIVVIFLGIIGGIFAGEVFYISWFSGFISGMFFIALSEIIELIDQKLEFSNERLSNLESLLKTTSFVDKKVIENSESESAALAKEVTYENKNQILTNEEAEFIKDYYNNKNIKVKSIVKSPIDEYCLVVLENVEHDMVELGGFKPIVKSRDEWKPELKQWYDNEGL